MGLERTQDLFVNILWSDLIPNAKEIVIYRHFDHVVDSLIRREYHQQKVFKRRNFILKFLHIYVIFPFLKTI